MKYKLTDIFLQSIIICQITVSVFAQGSAGDAADRELRKLIDLQTAGVLKGGDFGLEMNILPNGVLISEFSLGVFKNFNLGISYGAANFIGSGKLDYYKVPGFKAKLRIVTETRRAPSFTIGFDSQGKGAYIDSLNRYEIKSPGAFIGALKNFKLLGYLSIHALANYSFEKDDKDINFMFGVEKTIGPSISVIAEYDLAINDNSNNSTGRSKGYLNAGLRWSVAESLTLGVDFRNILDNKKNVQFNGPERGLFIEYHNNLF